VKVIAALIKTSAAITFNLEGYMKQHNAEIEQYRVSVGKMKSDSSYGNNGIFVVRSPRGNNLICISSDGGKWDHVSIEVEQVMPGLDRRLPYWDEMCFIKDLFWREDECVIQYHPKKKDYKNLHPWVLHLWKPQQGGLPIPPIEFV